MEVETLNSERTLTVIIKGRVLAANLRSSIQRQATRLDLCGYVQALPDRSLELVASGESQALDDFLSFLRKDQATNVEDISVSWGDEPVKESRFTIRGGA